MQSINQLFFTLFALILLGVLSSTSFKSHVGEQTENRNYWLLSILLRAMAYLSWALIPYLGKPFLLFANALFTASILLLVLFIRSWRCAVGSRVTNPLAVLWVMYVVVFAYFLIQPGSFTERYILTGSCIILGSTWEFYETYRKSKTDKSFLLRVLLGIVLVQFLLAVVTIATRFVERPVGQDNILQVGPDGLGVIFLWVTFGAHLLSYIIINSYLYEKLHLDELRALTQLREKQSELLVTTQEKEDVEQLLKEREQLITSLMRANKTASTGAMAASIAHEMAQPLAVIQMNAEFLNKLNTEHSLEQPVVEDMLTGILRNNRHAGNIVKTLRGIFMDSPSIFTRTNLLELVQSVVQLAHSDIHKRGVRLSVEIDPFIEVDLYANEMFQVLLNLLNNALQALVEKPIGEGSVRFAAQLGDGIVTLLVSDNGPGIEAAVQAQLFSLFASSNKPESMGLGLWLCAYIVQRHRGKIWYEEMPESGARFMIRLPLDQTRVSADYENR